MLLFIMLYKVVLIFKSVNENLLCDQLSSTQFNVALFIMLYKYFQTS